MFEKYLIAFGAVFLIILSSTNVKALIDDTDDIFYSLGDGEYEDYEYSKEDIDIVNLTYSINDKVAVILKINGTLRKEIGYGYFVYISLNGSDDYDYYASYTKSGVKIFDDNLTNNHSFVSSNSLAFYFEIDDPENVSEVWAWTYQSKTSESQEKWVDWAPDIYFPAYSEFYDEDIDDKDNTGGDGDGDGDSVDGEENKKDSDSNTPGFEIFALISAISIAIIILKKRK